MSFLTLAAIGAAGDAVAAGRRLSPQNFNKMYYLASQGKIGILREAVNRGLDIDSLNPNGDTGLCIAIKRNNYIAYNSFRMSGANPRHQCTYKIYKEYQEFLDTNKTVHTEKVLGNEESLYYRDEERNWWPWILGGAAVGGGILALSSGGGKSTPAPEIDTSIIPTNPGYGLTAFLDNYSKLIDSGKTENNLWLDGANPNAEAVVDNILFFPDMLSNALYLKTYVKVINGASFYNATGGGIRLGDAAVGISAYGKDSLGQNNGTIEIEAKNGSIGMAASNGASVINGTEGADGAGDIKIVFKGTDEGNAVIGMYADTNSDAVNYGTITGVSVGNSDGGGTSSEWSDLLIDDNEEEESGALAPNSGTILGMALYDFYTGTNFSANTVSATNYGTINLSAGYNSATDVGISLVGMGSYVDDKFLNGNNNPAYAEKMALDNHGDINISYQGTYNLSDTALKLGDGGLTGMRADASAEARNEGNINIKLTDMTVSDGTDVAAGMLSVHGAELVNGNADTVYTGTGKTGGTIEVLASATQGGVSYGMLAAKGDGTQTGLYEWKAPQLTNYGLVDMKASNAYAMASFAGGEVVNEGVINLGVENGQSYYTGNYGLYAAGDADTKEVSLINRGIINVYSEQSTAIYNAFTGAVDIVNEGSIYISQKATGSQVFDGNFSSATNKGNILYKVGNSDSFTPGLGTVQTEPAASVVSASSDGTTTKQLAVNAESGLITVGEERSAENYGGTFVTAGMQVSKQAAAVNKGTINLQMYDKDVLQYNVGMWLDSTTTSEAYADNYGSIVVGAGSSIGIRNDSASGATATNFGCIYVNGIDGIGMATTGGGSIFNGRYKSSDDDVNIINVAGKGGIGMYSSSGKIYNYGMINLLASGTTAFKIAGSGASIESFGDIAFISGLSDITYFEATDDGVINLSYPGGIEVEGFTLAKAVTENSGGTVNFSGTAYVRGVDSHALVADGESVAVINNGRIYASAGAKGTEAYNGAEVTNNGMISVSDASSYGIYATGGSVMTNNGTVTVTSGTGVYLSGEGTTGTNAADAEILATGNGSVAVYVGAGTTLTNNGTISGTTSGSGEIVEANETTSVSSIASISDIILVEDGGTFVNAGEVDLSGAAVDFGTKGDSGTYVIADGGTYKAESFRGDVVVGKDVVMGSFNDTYTVEGAFRGKNEGLNATSQSYMFEAGLKDTDTGADAELTRKKFEDLVYEEDIARFLESNYNLGNNVNLFDALKGAEDKKEFDYAKETELGEKFYADIARENVAVLRGMNSNEQRRILEDGLDGASVGATYFKTGKDGVGGLSGFSDDVYGVYASYGVKLNGGMSIGGVLTGAYADSEYDEAHSQRNNKILMALMPVMYQSGGFKFLTMPEAGVGFGTYKRRAISGVYEADTLDFYYGIANHAEYSIDMKIAELVSEAELNFLGMSMSEAEEDGGLNLRSNNLASLEGGIGLKLRKRIELSKQRSLMLALGAKYYHEFLDPYKRLSVGMDGSPIDYRLDGYNERKDRIKTTAEAVYKDGNFALSAEISHNAEAKDSIEGGVGVRYNF